ncbi:hypothetical protein ABEW19_23885 [Paenibacillus illinoisensis]|uniref:hypothetical protein n=1 Tax=Paenibacillus illinoisensis TaxID=59845 RepID=UPI003D2E6EB5
MKTSLQMFYITEQCTDMQTIEHVGQNNRSAQEEVSASVEEVTATMQEQAGMTEHLAEMVQTIDTLTKRLAAEAAKFKTN